MKSREPNSKIGLHSLIKKKKQEVKRRKITQRQTYQSVEKGKVRVSRFSVYPNYYYCVVIVCAGAKEVW